MRRVLLTVEEVLGGPTQHAGDLHNLTGMLRLSGKDRLDALLAHADTFPQLALGEAQFEHRVPYTFTDTAHVLEATESVTESGHCNIG